MPLPTTFAPDAIFSAYNAQTQTLSFNGAPDEQLVQNLIDDFKNVGLDVVYSKQKNSITLENTAKGMDDLNPRIAKVLYKYRVIEKELLTDIEDKFIKYFISTIAYSLDEEFETRHATFIKKLEQFNPEEPIGKNLPLVKQIIDTLRSNATPLNDLPDYYYFPKPECIVQDAKTVTSILEGRYNNEIRMQNVVTLANQKARWQALVSKITPEEIQAVNDLEVKNGLEIVSRLPLEIPFQVVDQIHPDFPKVKFPNDLLNSYVERIERERDAKKTTIQLQFV